MMEQAKIGSYGGRIKWCLLVYFCVAVLFFWSLYPLVGWTVPGVMPWLLGAGMLALIVYTLRLLDKQVDVKDEERLSFRWAGIHKYFWGLTWWALDCALWVALLLGWNRPQDRLSFLIGGCVLAVFLLVTCMMWFLKVVYVREGYIHISNYFAEKRFQVSEVRGLSFFNAMGILVLSHDGKKRYYCFVERLGKPQEVEGLENDLKRRAWFYKQMERKKF